MLKVFISAFICIVALFLSLDTFRNQREVVLGLAPRFIRDIFEAGNDKEGSPKELVLSKDELSRYTGEDDRKVYLALLGQVFDVTKGKQHYGPGGGYHFFAGKDGSRGFVSGEFTDAGLIEDCSGLSHQDMLGLEEWLEFYHKTYKYIGKLNGHYYDKDGNALPPVTEFEQKLGEAKKDKSSQEEDMRMFPPCNSEFKRGIGRRLWCSNWSGGIQRDWTGLPRQYFKPGQRHARCACVKDIGPPSDDPGMKNHLNNGDLNNPNMKLYDGCDPKSQSCSFPE
ncbi:hypothetical protein ScPMuIL_006942 [Solemya velum]